MEQPITAPVLQIHGLSDGAVLPRSVDGSEQFVRGAYTRRDLPNLGHFPHEEDPDRFAEVVLPWLADVHPVTAGSASSAGPLSQV
jgi:pimeloyl-ACP methyl ester carboxylesterase